MSRLLLIVLLCIGCTETSNGGSPADAGDRDVDTVDAPGDVGTDGQEDAADDSAGDSTGDDIGAQDTPPDIPADSDVTEGDATPDATDVPDVMEEPDVEVDTGPSADVAEPGCFFTSTGPDDTRRYDFGVRGEPFDRVDISFTVTLARWRDELFDREVLTHIFFGLFRNAPVSRGRYILGAAAQIRPARIPGTRQAVFFARVDLEERPQGEGYTAYTSFRRSYPWEPGTTYHVHAALDVGNKSQHLIITPQGGEPFQIDGEIAYFDRSLTSNGWWLQLGAEDTDHRDVNVVDWTFCDLEIRTQ